MSGKYALIIGNTEYVDSGLAQLTAPGKDAEDFAGVLKDQNISAFDSVNVLVNQPSSFVIEAIDEFFDQKKPDDLLVLYFSGHGVKDEGGSLYLAFKNTIRSRLRSTAIKSDYIREAMDQSRSKRQVLILDCCNSGAFPQGTKAELGGSMGMTKAFQGYGRFVLTASDSTQFAWEGDKVIGEDKTANSLFTHFLVKGLKGEADRDGDGKITVDELYDYAFQEISKVTPNQTPTKSSSKQEGEIILRENMRIEDIKPMPLPDDLVSEMEDLRPLVREGAVQRLERILKGRNIGMARSAVEALEKIAADENTTRRVAQAATRALDAFRQKEKKAEEERTARAEEERKAILQAEEERLTREKAEAEQRAREETEKLLRAHAEREAAELLAARLKEERKAAEAAAREAKEKVDQETAEHSSTLKAGLNWKSAIIAIQKALGPFVSIFSAKKKMAGGWYLAIGVVVFLLVASVSWFQLVYLASSSVDQQVINYALIERISIKDNVDYDASSLFLKGMRIEVEIKTANSLRDQPCQVIIFFQRSDNDYLTMPRSFTTLISPYISTQDYVSVYKNITPKYDRSNIDIKLFIPYAALASSELPSGETTIMYFASLYNRNDYSLIARSPSASFKYTK